MEVDIGTGATPRISECKPSEFHTIDQIIKFRLC